MPDISFVVGEKKSRNSTLKFLKYRLLLHLWFQNTWLCWCVLFSKFSCCTQDLSYSAVKLNIGPREASRLILMSQILSFGLLKSDFQWARRKFTLSAKNVKTAMKWQPAHTSFYKVRPKQSTGGTRRKHICHGRGTLYPTLYFFGGMINRKSSLENYCPKWNLGRVTFGMISRHPVSKLQEGFEYCLLLILIHSMSG